MFICPVFGSALAHIPIQNSLHKSRSGRAAQITLRTRGFSSYNASNFLKLRISFSVLFAERLKEKEQTETKGKREK